VPRNNPHHLTIPRVALPSALLLLLTLAMLARWQMQPVSPLPSTAPEQIFSAGRAYAQLATLLQEQRPHPVDSAQNRVVEQRIVAALHALNIETEIQATTVCADLGSDITGLHRCAQVRNIVARVPGNKEEGHEEQGQSEQEQSEQASILLSAHYDSVPAAPGASDAGAAVASLLEIARLLSIQAKPPRNGIVLLFNEGEEFGLLGAKAFMEQHPWARALKVVLNIEARGSGGASILFETGSDSGWLVQHYAAATPAPLSSSLFDVLYRWLPNDTDLTVYKQYGLQGLNFAHAELETQYHSPLDNLATLDQGSLQHHGDNVWGVLQQIKDADLSAAPTGNRVFTDVLGGVMLSWPEAWSPWLAAGLLLVFVALVWRAPVSARNLTQAFGLMLLIPAASGLAGWLLLQLLTWRSDLRPMRLALWSIVTLTALTLMCLLTRRPNLTEHMLAQSLFWLLLALAASLLLPGVSMLALLPGALCLLALLIARSARPAAQVCAASILMPLSGGLFILPLTLNLELLAGFHLAPVQAAVLGLTLCALAPVYLAVQCSPRKYTVEKLLYAGLILTLLGGSLWARLQPAYTPWLPQHLNLRYVQQEPSAHNELSAHMLIDSPHPHIPETLATALGPIKTGNILPWPEGSTYYSEVQNAGLAPTQLNVIASENIDSGRRVSLALHTPDQAAEMLTLLIPASAGLERIEAHGITLPYPATSQTGHHVYQCIGLACNDLALTLHLRSQSPAHLILIQSRHGLPPSLQHLDSARGELAIERQNGDRSMVVITREI
jgi:hypothetical protein